VHHTATPLPDSVSVVTRLRGIQNYHIDTRGWCDIGYHYLVTEGDTVPGIDELLGGYWDHRKETDIEKIRLAFEKRWSLLAEEHLLPMSCKARHFGVSLIFPYLSREVIDYISRIPVEERTSREESKIPLRKIALNENYLPFSVTAQILQRKKLGFCDAMENAADIAKRT